LIEIKLFNMCLERKLSPNEMEAEAVFFLVGWLPVGKSRFYSPGFYYWCTIPLVWEVWGSNPEPIKSPKRCQQLALAATLMCGPWRKAAEMGTAHSW